LGGEDLFTRDISFLRQYCKWGHHKNLSGIVHPSTNHQIRRELISKLRKSTIDQYHNILNKNNLHGIKPDISIVTEMISGYMKEGRLDWVEDCLQWLKKRNEQEKDLGMRKYL